MLTIAFLLAGIFSFFVVAIITIYRLVIQRRSIPELPRWEPALGVANAVLAMAFFSLGIYRSLDAQADEINLPTPRIEVVGTAPASGPTVIIVPAPTAPAAPTPPPIELPEAPSQPTPTPIEPDVRITRPEEGATVGASARAEGSSQGVAAGQASSSPRPWLYLLVRREGGGGPVWWVQSYPVVDPDGSWTAFLTHGLSDVTSGTEFDICAIVSNNLLPTGRRFQEPAALSRDCVTVQLA